MLKAWQKLQKGGVSRRLAGGAVLTLGVTALSVAGVPLAATSGWWPGTAEAWAGTVTVQRGQTLTRIAIELHTSVAALAAANGLSDPNRVLAGELLQVPSSGATANAGVGPQSVVVQTGQTLTAIAARYGVTVAALAADNGLGDPDRVLAGAVLRVPVASPSGTATVVVSRGQTLTAIAARYGVTVAALAAANHLADPNRVLAGSRLVVPGGSSAMALASYSLPAGPSGGGIPAALAAHPARLALESDFASAGARYGVPVPLLEALCWWESGWQTAIVSLTGAVGVCQIEPATAGFVDRRLTGDQLDPGVAAQNIAIGAAYLASLLRATGGDVGQAVAGYYQGLTSVRRQGMFPSTAHYVRGILAYEAIFAG